MDSNTVTAAKKTADEEQVKEAEPAEEVVAEPETAEAEASAKPAASSSGRRPLGAKEVIPFEWKLVGKSGGLYLTLFKAIEQEDVEAQLERVRAEGYYTDLKVLKADEAIKQGKALKALKDAAAQDSTKPEKSSRKANAPAPQSTPIMLKPKASSKARKEREAKEAAAKASRKTSKKSAGKKAASRRSTAKTAGKSAAKKSTSTKSSAKKKTAKTSKKKAKKK